MALSIKFISSLIVTHNMSLFLLLGLITGVCLAELTTEEIVQAKEKSMKKFRLDCDDKCALGSDETEDDIMRKCMCDENCSMYGDCCADSEEMNITTVESWANRFECLDLSHEKNGINTYFMLSTCPPEWEDESVRELCENAETTANDPVMSTPVTNKESVLTFRNTYCAICNGEHDPQTTQLWTPFVSCPDVPHDTEVSFSNNTLSWDEVNKIWTIEAVEDQVLKRYSCTISYPLPDDLQNFVRSCIPYTKVSCRADSELTTMCKSYLAPVEINDITYKNIHCAACEGILTYEKGEIKRPKSGIGKPLPIDCGGIPGNPHHIDNTFSILFDFRNAGGSDKVGSVCNTGELFDPFLKKCRAIFCPTNRILKQGKCVVPYQPTKTEKDLGRRLNENKVSTTTMESATETETIAELFSFTKRQVTTENFSSTETQPQELPADVSPVHENETCAKIRLDTSEYELKDNGAIYIFRYERIVSFDEYQTINGSILICAHDLTDGAKFDQYLRGFSLFFLGLSEICLLLHISFGFLTDDFQNLSGKSIQSLSFSLFIGFGLFLIMQYIEGHTLGCAVVAILAHYFFLSAFWWSSVMAFDVFRTLHLATTQLRCPDKQKQRFILYSLWAWLTPAVLVTTAVIIEYLDTEQIIPPQFHPNYGQDICWIGQKIALLIYFVSPLAIILTCNFILFFWTLYVINSNSLRRVESKKEAILFIRLAVLMGLSWVTGIIAGAANVTFLWYVFVLLCASQGVFILVVFTLNAKTVRVWYNSRSSTGEKTGRSTVSSLWTTAQGTFQPSYYSVCKQLPSSNRASKEP